MAADDAAAISCVNGADTTWVMISFVLVLTMMPGLAFFEAGMLRSKNALSIISLIFVGMAVLSVMWALFGYSLTFGRGGGKYIGSFNDMFMLGVSEDQCNAIASTIPEALFALFQMMFACIAPLLMTGAWAECITWSGALYLIIGFEIFIYYPVAHWIWGDGWMAHLGVQDFAGGIVVHGKSLSLSPDSLFLSLAVTASNIQDFHRAQFTHILIIQNYHLI
jgi:Amt family ammonium transporter